jgi:hypothetical protein
MRPFLRRRRFDWDWHFRVLETALKAVGSLLVPEGHVVTLFSGPDEALLESVCLAANCAGYALNGWGYSPGAGYRLVWRWEQDVVPSTGSGDGRREITTAEVEAFERELMTAAEQALVKTLQERGEPTEWALLHSSAYAGLAERGLLARVAAIPEDGDSPKAFAFAADAVRRAFEAAPITQLTSREGSETALWDLVDSSHAAGLLADRVGVLVWELLAQLPAWAPEELVDAVYARFPGPVTPDLALVLVCIDSYSVREGDVLRLRPEDNPRRRASERKTLRNNLMVLGKRLGFKVKRGRGWDVRWLVDSREAYVFDVSVAVTLGRHLLTERDADEGAQRCLVVPGGRAGLIDFKLQRDHRLAHAVERDGWQFIKFRHLRRLLAEEDLDRHALKTVLGLDPIAEQEAAQIPLF